LSEANGRLDQRIQEITMFKRSFVSALIAIFVATGALAVTVQSSSAYGMHHHHHHHYEDYEYYQDYPDSGWWFYHHHHHHHHYLIY
jgi:hypothetical protein